MTKTELRHVETLVKRLEHLHDRVRNSTRDLSYDKREIGALRWCLSVLADQFKHTAYAQQLVAYEEKQ